MINTLAHIKKPLQMCPLASILSWKDTEHACFQNQTNPHNWRLFPNLRWNNRNGIESRSFFRFPILLLAWTSSPNWSKCLMEKEPSPSSSSYGILWATFSIYFSIKSVYVSIWSPILCFNWYFILDSLVWILFLTSALILDLPIFVAFMVEWLPFEASIGIRS